MIIENAPQQEARFISTIEQEKKKAGEFVKTRIQELQAEGKSKLEAVKIVYDTVKGHEYRQEQALAKLLEYFNLKEEVSNRAIEIKTQYPAFSILVEEEYPAANDKKYMTQPAS